MAPVLLIHAANPLGAASQDPQAAEAGDLEATDGHPDLATYPAQRDIAVEQVSFHAATSAILSMHFRQRRP